MRSSFRNAGTAAWLVALLACGCGERSAGNGPEDGPRADAPADAPLDASPDASADVGPGDVGSDLGADVVPEPAADAGTDARADSGADSGAADLGSDAVLDMGPDATPAEAGTGDAGCVPLAADPSAIGDNCEGPPGEPDPSACPAGYECIPFAGFVGTFTCEIPCTQTCECPPPSTCGMRCDKLGCIDACVP